MGLFNKLPFKDKPNTAVFTCTCILNNEKPILYITHDEDGTWQFLCGDEHTENDARIVSLEEIYKPDKTIGKVSNIEYGKTATRIDKTSNWIIS